jgi:putative DNA primase/helicase
VIVADAPDWLLTAISKPVAPKETSGSILSEGRRNSDLTSIAGLMRRKGGTEEEIQQVLNAINSSSANPLPAQEVASIAASVCRYEPAAIGPLTEQRFSELIAESFSGNTLYCPGLDWMYYDGAKWRSDAEGLQTQEHIKNLAKSLYQIAQDRHDLESKEFDKLIKAMLKLQKQSFISSATKLAKSSQNVLASADSFDRSRNLFNVANGTIDLDTLEFRPHDSADRITKATDIEFDPDARCPVFDRFLAQALPQDIGSFFLRAAGYALQGQNLEQVLFVLLGPPKNGKSTLLNAVSAVFGEYGASVDPLSFAVRNNATGVNNDLARLAGIRLAASTETPEGMVLNAALIKRMTGGEKIVARHLYKDFLEFLPSFVIFIATNYPPIINGSDRALGRRLVLIPFEGSVSSETRDLELPAKLLAERSGILNRILEGLRDYRQNGLRMPDAILRATAEYIDDSDVMKNFIEECCVLKSDSSVSAGQLYDCFYGWTSRAGLPHYSKPQFKRAFATATGLKQKRQSKGMVWIGAGLSGPAY